MNVTIKFRLSSAGQKASILNGGDGKASQVLTVERDHPDFAACLAVAQMQPDGSAIIDQYYPPWDTIPTAGEILASEVAKVTAAAAEKTAAAARYREETLAVLTARKTQTDSSYVNGEKYIWQVPAWPYNADAEVKASPEAAAWIAELDAAREVAKAAAIVTAETAAAAAKVEAEAKAARTAAWREKMGLEDDELALKVEDGALTTVPSGCWQTHSRGKNWMATIEIDPSKPGGLDRAFWTKAKGSSYYLLASFTPGEAIEFGADYYSGSGKKSANRWYGYIVRLIPASEGEVARLVVVECDTGKAAVKAGKEFAKTAAPAPLTEVEAAIARVNGEGAIVPTPSAN